MYQKKLENIINCCLNYDNNSIYCDIINEQQCDFFNNKYIMKKRNIVGLRITLLNNKNECLIIDKINLERAHIIIKSFMKKNNIKKNKDFKSLKIKNIPKKYYSFSKNKKRRIISLIYDFLTKKIN